MAGNRHRNMYYLTGLPGWIRFGYSPGWVGRSPTGLPPTAQYLMQSGQMPQYMSYLQQQAPVGAPVAPMMPTGMPKEEEVQMLEGQAKMMEQQLEQIKKRLEELK
jgi:hypothetical protein